MRISSNQEFYARIRTSDLSEYQRSLLHHERKEQKYADANFVSLTKLPLCTDEERGGGAVVERSKVRTVLED